MQKSMTSNGLKSIFTLDLHGRDDNRTVPDLKHRLKAAIPRQRNRKDDYISFGKAIKSANTGEPVPQTAK
jgi:hypothetical protein